MKPEVTILTPTWNRRHLLPRLYQSLITQDVPSNSFEWLVVDDGSSDGTSEWINSIQIECPFTLRLLTQENLGKCAALNLGAINAQGSWITIVDSDDFLVKGSIKNILELKNIADNEGVGIVFCLQDNSRENHSFRTPEKLHKFYQWANASYLFDSVQIVLTSVLARHPYPVTPGEKYFPESWLFHQIDMHYNAKFFNVRLVRTQYQKDGLSSKSRELRAASPLNAMITYDTQIRSRMRFTLRCRAAANYFRYLLHAKYSKRGCNTKSLPIPFKLFFLAGLFLFIQDLFYMKIYLKLKNTVLRQ